MKTVAMMLMMLTAVSIAAEPAAAIEVIAAHTPTANFGMHKLELE